MQQDDLIITASTKKQKEQELHLLRTVERPRIVEQIKKAREYGDLSENFEYAAARQAQAILNGRIADLEALLERAKIVEDDTENGDKVGLGSVVTVRDEETEDEWDFIIVDATSADPLNDRISYSSPVGNALLGRTIGEIVEIDIPDGRARYIIIALQ